MKEREREKDIYIERERESKSEREQTLSNSSFNKILHCIKKIAFWFLLEKRLTDGVNGSETSPADYVVRLKTDPQVVRG